MVRLDFAAPLLNECAFEQEPEFFLFLDGTVSHFLNQSFKARTHVGNLAVRAVLANAKCA